MPSPSSSASASDAGASPTVVTANPAVLGGADAVVPGGTLGRYVILERLGAGGMGVVARAYDPKLRREVALKRLRAGLLDDRLHARLMREAQAMARLSHPNVVAVYDVDVDDGAVVLAMEYVAGHTLQDWLAAGPHATDRVIAALAQAGEGLDAAHRVGLVHRDFKPANVLVTEDERVKVTDFGLAKPAHEAAESEGGDGDAADPDLTAAGTVMGTPRYMAPEQHTGGEVDARADQYAFCVTLWEALVGRPPFSGKLEALAQAKHAGPPAWPRDVPVPSSIVRAITRGLSVEPADRWPSMAMLLDELRTAKGRRRRRLVTGVSAGIVVLLTAAGIWTWPGRGPAPCEGASEQLDGVWDGPRRTQVRTAIEGTALAYAKSTADRVDTGLDAYATAWADHRTEACAATSIRGEQSAETMDLRMICLDRAKSELGVVTSLLAIADEDVVEEADALVASLPSLARCADVEALRAAIPPPEDPETAAAVEETRHRVAEGRALYVAGKYEEAEKILAEAEARAREIGYLPLLANALGNRGAVLDKRAEFDAAIAALREALRLTMQSADDDELINVTSHLALLLGRQGRVDEASWIVDITWAAAQRTGRPGAIADAQSAAAMAASAAGREEEAEREFRAALEYWERTRGPEHPQVIDIRNNLGLTLERLGRLEEAEAEHRRTLEVRRRTLGEKHPHVAMSHNNLGNALSLQKKYDEAEAELRAGLRLREELLGPDHPYVAGSHVNLGNVAAARGDLDAAEREYGLARDGLTRKLGPEHPYVAGIRNNMGELYQRRGDDEKAAVELRAALDIWGPKLGQDHPQVTSCRNSLASSYLRLGKAGEARPLLEVSRDACEAGKNTEHCARVAWLLAQAIDAATDDRDAAIALAREARAAFAEGPERDDEDHGHVEAWLAERHADDGG